MPVAVNEMLSLKFPKDKFEDFYLYELTLQEEISQLYRAEAVVLSDKLYLPEQLQEALSLGVTITITQRLSDTKTKRSRYFHGIVTGISHSGVFYSSDKKDCYCYRLTIEPDISVLRHVVRKAAYNRKTPIDIISEILSAYGITPNFPEELISRRPFIANCIYNQETESDYAFLKRLCGLYGLSFTFKHTQSALTPAQLYFSEGVRFTDWTDISYSDGRKEPPVSEFDFRLADEARNLWRLETWSMRRDLGIDGVLLQETYPNVNVGSYDWKVGLTGDGDRRRVYTRHFHNYVRETPKDQVDADIKLILQAQYRSFQCAKDVWQGKGDNLLLTPCRMFRLSHFFGKRDGTPVTAMITKSVLHCRAKWPQALAVSPSVDGAEEEIEISFWAKNAGNDADRRFCPMTVEKKD